MHFVDGDRRVAAVAALAFAASTRRRAMLRRLRIVPDDRSIRRPQFGIARKRIGFERKKLAVRRLRSRTCSRAPSRAPGTKISQTPHSTRLRMGWRRPSQSLKSPTTLTRRAFGAQTAKATPATPSIVRHVRAEHLPKTQMRAFGDEVRVHFTENRTETVGILDLFAAGGRVDDEYVVERVLGVAESAVRRDPVR